MHCPQGLFHQWSSGRLIIEDLWCLPPCTSTPGRLPDGSEGPHEGHTVPDKPRTGPQHSPECQSNNRLMPLCMETDTLAYKGTCIFACVHIHNQTQLFRWGLMQLKEVQHVALWGEVKLTLPSVTFTPWRAGACTSHKYIACKCVSVCTRGIMSENRACNPVILQD